MDHEIFTLTEKAYVKQDNQKRQKASTEDGMLPSLQTTDFPSVKEVSMIKMKIGIAQVKMYTKTKMYTETL